MIARIGESQNDLSKNIIEELLAYRALTMAMLHTHPDINNVKTHFIKIKENHVKLFPENNPECTMTFEAWDQIISNMDKIIQKRLQSYHD